MPEINVLFEELMRLIIYNQVREIEFKYNDDKISDIVLKTFNGLEFTIKIEYDKEGRITKMKVINTKIPSVLI